LDQSILSLDRKIVGFQVLQQWLLLYSLPKNETVTKIYTFYSHSRPTVKCGLAYWILFSLYLGAVKVEPNPNPDLWFAATNLYILHEAHPSARVQSRVSKGL